MPVEQLVRRLADNKQYYTMHGGMRPYGVSVLYAGWDKHLGFQLYLVSSNTDKGPFECNINHQGDPSGNYGGWKATCIGSNAQSALSMLEQDYKEEFDIEEALNLAMTILSKTLDTQTLK